MAFPEEASVIQDLGTGVIKVRFTPLPGNTPLGVTLIYQMKKPLLTSLAQTFAPFPDEYDVMLRQCFKAAALRYAGSKQAEIETQRADAIVMAARGRDDAEESEEYIIPDDPLMGYTGAGGGGWWI